MLLRTTFRRQSNEIVCLKAHLTKRLSLSRVHMGAILRPNACSLVPSKTSRQCQHLSPYIPQNLFVSLFQHRNESSSQPTAPSVNDKLPPYVPPTTGILSYFPRAVVPYLELSRIASPAGIGYLYFPCLFSTLLASNVALPTTQVLAHTSFLFLAGAIVMRGAGCCINDLWDRNLDRSVARTRLRPIARGAISVPAALVYTAGQLLVGLGILLQFPPAAVVMAIPSMALVTAYPLAKRVTNYPQIVLGATFSVGSLLGFPALGVDLLADPVAATAAGFLWASSITWTLVYDTVYAFQDVKDDAKAGIKSSALAQTHSPKRFLGIMAGIQTTLLGLAGYTIGLGPVFYIGSCGGAAATLGLMITKVRLGDVASCAWWFKNGCWFTGFSIAAGLLGEYLMQTTEVVG